MAADRPSTPPGSRGCYPERVTSPQRFLLRALLGSIAVSAALGIWAVLGDFGRTGEEVLLTAMAISGASLLMMASLSSWNLANGRRRALVGAVSAGLSLVLVVPGMWLEVESDGWWRVAVTLLLVATHCAHGSLLQLARLAPRYQWSRWASIALAALLVVLILTLVWDLAEGDDFVFQVIGVDAILLAAATMAVGVFHWMSRVEVAQQGGAEVTFCPRCGKRLWQPAGEVRCPHCEARFFIELRPAGELPTAIARRSGDPA